MRMDIGAWSDATAFTLAIAALLAGTTPPAVASKEAKARAGKANGDLIQRYNISGNAFRYVMHGIFAALAAVHVYAIHQGSSGTAPIGVWHKVLWQQLRAGATGSSGSYHATLKNNASRWLQHGGTSPYLPAVMTSRLAFRLSCIVAFAAGLGRLACYRALGRFFTYDLAFTDGQKVIDTGLYAYVRHPSYTSILAATASIAYAIAIGPLMPPAYRPFTIFFALMSTVGTSRLVQLRVRDEEAMLMAELGPAYKQYRKKVPYKLIPRLY